MLFVQGAAAWLEALSGPALGLLPLKAYRLDLELLRLVDDTIPPPRGEGECEGPSVAGLMRM